MYIFTNELLAVLPSKISVMETEIRALLLKTYDYERMIDHMVDVQWESVAVAEVKQTIAKLKAELDDKFADFFVIQQQYDDLQRTGGVTV
jgi:hypothetical protein